MSFGLQTLMHRLLVGPGARIFRVLFVLTLMVALAAIYDIVAFRGFASREAMDMAQLGKNLAEGRGYRTLLIRPFSMFLVQRHRVDQSPQIKTAHPDLANPPAYPVLLAGLFKLVPAKYFVCPSKGFSIYLPELAVGIMNQALLLLAAVMLFFLTARLFEASLAWVASIVFVGCEALWRLSVSGLNTLLLMVLLLGVVWCLLILEQWARFGRRDLLLVLMAALTGLLLGLGGLTRYAFGWLVVPVLVFLIAFFGQKRALLCLVVVLTFTAVLSPWIVRNFRLSGLPFGTATFSLYEGTDTFPEDRLVRSLHPNLTSVGAGDLGRKFLQNSRTLVRNILPELGGSWVSALFLAGLLVPFRRPAAARLRWLLLLGLLTLGAVQTLSPPPARAESADINSSKMLILLSPLVIMYGVALFFQLLESLVLPFARARLVVTTLFCVVASAPLIQVLLPPHASPVPYPPYFPPTIQMVGGWFNEQELLMSDMPWAMAWYGRRQCAWVTLNWSKDFVEITDYQKPVKGLYLTPLTTDTPFLSSWVRGENSSWASFLMECIVQREVPSGFPLRRAPDNFFPEHILLTDYDRWRLRGP
jgi:hypothetical protein